MKFEDEIKTIAEILKDKLKSDTAYFAMAVKIQYPEKSKEEIERQIRKLLYV